MQSIRAGKFAYADTLQTRLGGLDPRLLDALQLEPYRLEVPILKGVSPLVWRRFLLSSETSLADLHKILQSAFSWMGPIN